MKALLFLVLWLGIGLAFASRRGGSPGERLMVTLFWVFFLGAPTEQRPTGALARLERACAGDRSAEVLLASLRREEQGMVGKVQRLEAACAEAADADARSLGLLESSLSQARAQLLELHALADEAAVRLLVSAERDGGTGRVLADLRARLDALCEVEAVQAGGGAQAPGS